MRSVNVFLLSLAALIIPFVNAYADSQYPGKFVLDQSKDVFFEKYNPTTYSLQLLKDKNKFDANSLVVGGVGEIDLQHWQGDKVVLIPPPVSYRDGTGLYFTEFTVDTLANLTSWSSIFFSGTDSHIGQGPPNGNYTYLSHLFVLFGNLEKSPFYFTLGTNTLPFGVFLGSGAWDLPLTANYFNPTLAPQFSLAFYKNGLNLSTAAYSDEVNRENHFIYSFNYNKAVGNLNYSLGAGYLTNLKTNTTGNPTINRMRRSKALIPVNMGNIWDFNASLGYKLIALSAEYDVASRKIGVNQGDPSAFAISFTFTPKIGGEDTTFGITRSQTFYLNNVPTNLSGLDAVPFTASGLKSNWAASVSRSIFTNYITLGFDAQRTVTYSDEKTYTYTLDLLVYI